MQAITSRFARKAMRAAGSRQSMSRHPHEALATRTHTTPPLRLLSTVSTVTANVWVNKDTKVLCQVCAHLECCCHHLGATDLSPPSPSLPHPTQHTRTHAPTFRVSRASRARSTLSRLLRTAHRWLLESRRERVARPGLERSVLVLDCPTDPRPPVDLVEVLDSHTPIPLTLDLSCRTPSSPCSTARRRPWTRLVPTHL